MDARILCSLILMSGIFYGVAEQDSCYVPVICDGQPNWMKKSEVLGSCPAETCKKSNCNDEIKTLEETIRPELEQIQNQINQLLNFTKNRPEKATKTISPATAITAPTTATTATTAPTTATTVPTTAITAPTTATTVPTTTTIAQTLTSCINATMDEALSWNGTGGIFNISTESFPDGIEVYCDLTSDGGGWTVFQRRMDGSVDFYRGWDDYVNGFGEKDKEFWLGLETIYQLTKNGSYELRVDLIDWEGESRYAQYGTFSITASNDNYRLTVGDYNGTAGDSFARHSGHLFSTKDRDNDGSSRNCAVKWTGAWWYGACAYSNLNGVYHVGGTGASSVNIVWRHWRNTYNYSYKFTEMKFRKKQN